MTEETAPSAYALTQEILESDIIQIFVGPARKKFNIHKKLLCDRSEFFAAAFRGQFKEGQEGKIYLPEDHPETVTILIDYIYRNVIPEYDDTSYATACKCLELYYLAEKYCMSDCMDRILNSIDNGHTAVGLSFSPDAIKSIYWSTHETSKLRLFCAAEIACSVGCLELKGTNAYDELIKDCPEFFLDFFRFHADNSMDITKSSSATFNSKITIPNFDFCEFHTHPKQKNCSNKKISKVTMGSVTNNNREGGYTFVGGW